MNHNSLTRVAHEGRQKTGTKQMLIVMWLVLTPASVQAQVNINTGEVKKAVVFLYAAKESEEVDRDKPLGTGFLVEVPLQSNPQRVYKLLEGIS